MNRAVAALSIVMLASAGCNDGSVRPVGEAGDHGGCVTVAMTEGLAIDRAEPPESGPLYSVRLCSIEPPDPAAFTRIAEELTAVIDAEGILLYSRSELLHVIGVCWPDFVVVILVEIDAAASDALRERLASSRLGGVPPCGPRPAEGGLFFVACSAAGEAPSWSLWYDPSCAD